MLDEDEGWWPLHTHALWYSFRREWQRSSAEQREQLGERVPLLLPTWVRSVQARALGWPKPRHNPWTRTLELDSRYWPVPRMERRLQQLPHIRVAGFRYAQLGAHSLQYLVDSPVFAERDGVLISRQRLAPELIELLTHAPVMARWRVLGLNWVRLKLEGLDALLRSPHIGGLEQLTLARPSWRLGEGAEALGKLASTPALSQLHSLSLRWFEAHKFAQLAGASFRTQLRWLELPQNKLGGALAELLGPRGFPGLRYLDASYCTGGKPSPAFAKGLIRAARSGTGLEQLEYLNLYNDVIGDEAAQALAESEGVSKLRVLVLGSCSLHRSGLEALASSRRLARLRSLDLSSNYLSEGVEALAKGPLLLGLRYLRLADNHLDDGSLAALVSTARGEALRGLDVSNNHKLSEAGILDNLSRLKSLRYLDVTRSRGFTPWPRAFRRRLQEALPDCVIVA